MSSTTTSRIYRQGEVVVVSIPFSDQSGTKARPALVVSVQTFHRSLPDTLVCPISSQPRHYRRPGPGDVPLRSWSAAGLRHPSTARVSKVLAVDNAIVRAILGRVAADDLDRIKHALRSAFGL